MGVIGDNPSYPVVDRAPTVRDRRYVHADELDPRRGIAGPTPADCNPEARPRPFSIVTENSDRDDPCPRSDCRPLTAFPPLPRRSGQLQRDGLPRLGNVDRGVISRWAGCRAPVRPRHRVPAMYASGLIGGLAGFMWAYQSSGGRLMGFLPKRSRGEERGAMNLREVPGPC